MRRAMSDVDRRRPNHLPPPSLHSISDKNEPSMCALMGKRCISGTPSEGSTMTPRQSVMSTRDRIVASRQRPRSSKLTSTMSESMPTKASSMECSQAAGGALLLLLFFRGSFPFVPGCLQFSMFCGPLRGAWKCSFSGKRSGEGMRCRAPPCKSTSTPWLSVATKKRGPSPRSWSVGTPCFSSLLLKMPGQTSPNSISSETWLPR
mmetsp:Transcript_41333/g.106865  ORF Transcript_41333/g.106865 Transcript_41333/m.106865 type:complete len:205 (-) Transcript_41333:122-736(-)